MSTTREEVLKYAMQLSVADRVVLAAELMETVPEDLPGWSIHDEGFLAELDRRFADGTRGIPWETVKAELGRDQVD